MTAPWNPANYDQAWAKMAVDGKDPHGEVAFVLRAAARIGFSLQSVLDAGCGTGRVAVELDRRGANAEGTDIDGAMLDAARQKAPHLRWHHGDLATLDLGKAFTVVVAAGNVILFVDPEHRPAAAAGMARHVAPGGVLIAGMQLSRPDGRHVPVAGWAEWIRLSGLVEVERWATWDEDQFFGNESEKPSDYVVTVSQRPPASPQPPQDRAN